MGHRILALELSDDHVRAAIAERSFNGLELRGVREAAPLEGEKDLSGAIGRIVAAVGLPDITISALPGEFVAKRLLTLPFTDRRRLEKVVPFALEEHLPFAVDDAAVAFARVGRQDSSSLILAAYARKEELRRHLQVLAAAGIDPKTVTLSTHALAGLLARSRNGTGAHLVLEIEERSTSMVLIDQAGTPRAMRTVGQGLDLRTDTPQARGAARAILAAVRQTLLAHNSDHTPADLVLAGSSKATPAVKQELSNALEVAVRDLSEFDCSTLIQGVGKEPARFAGCIAMLLAEAPNAPLELLNFRKGEFTYHGRHGALAPFRITVGLAGAAVAAAVLHVALSMSVNARQLHLLNDQIAQVVAPALGDVDPATARRSLENKENDMTKRLRLLGGSLGHGSPLDVMLALSRSIPQAIPIQADTLEVDENGVKLAGSADSFATIDQIKRALERGGAFSAIQVEHAGSGSDSNKVEFRLSAQLKEDANY
jgi:hypothetical protein